MKTKTELILEAVADWVFARARLENMRGPMERHNQLMTVETKAQRLYEAWVERVKDGGAHAKD